MEDSLGSKNQTNIKNHAVSKLQFFNSTSLPIIVQALGASYRSQNPIKFTLKATQNRGVNISIAQKNTSNKYPSKNINASMEKTLILVRSTFKRMI